MSCESTFLLRLADGTQVATVTTAAPLWRVGDEIYAADRGRFYRVVAIVPVERNGAGDAVFVVERVVLGWLE